MTLTTNASGSLSASLLVVWPLCYVVATCTSARACAHIRDYLCAGDAWLTRLLAVCVCVCMCVVSRESWASSALLFQRNWRRPRGNYTPLLRLVKTSSNQVFLSRKVELKHTQARALVRAHARRPSALRHRRARSFRPLKRVCACLIFVRLFPVRLVVEVMIKREAMVLMDVMEAALFNATASMLLSCHCSSRDSWTKLCRFVLTRCCVHNMAAG